MSRAFLKEAGRVGEMRRRLTQTPHLKADPSPSLSLAMLVTPTTSTLVQDNISLILPLVFHLASTHLGRDMQRQIHWSVEGPRGSETPTLPLGVCPHCSLENQYSILSLSMSKGVQDKMFVVVDHPTITNRRLWEHNYRPRGR
jgi:hypothetical protein